MKNQKQDTELGYVSLPVQPPMTYSHIIRFSDFQATECLHNHNYHNSDYSKFRRLSVVIYAAYDNRQFKI